MSEYQSGTYVRGDSVKHAGTPAQAVALVWDGYKRADDPAVVDAPYAELKAQAKALGIPVKGSKDDLAAAIAAKAEETSPDGNLNTQDSSESEPDS